MTSSQNENKLISILICSKDRRSDLEKLISKIKDIKSDLSFELIVVEETNENRPIDSVIYIKHPIANRGIPYARNLALAHAKGHIVVFVDDDCIIHDQWLERLLEPFRESSVVGVQGGVTVPDGTNAIGWAESILGFPGGGIKRILEADGRVHETKEISTLNCAYRKWFIDRIGGFDDRLKLGGEDYVLAKKAYNYGKCQFIPDAIVSHEARGSLSKIWAWFVRRGRAEVNVIRTGTQKETTLGTVLQGSISVKLYILLLISLLFFPFLPGWPIPFLLLAVAILFFMAIQYIRYYKVWKTSSASFMALLLLPGIKLWMDTAMDWGRIRGLLFD
jgi:glycosyltransferase involved in cell wall biosynthesis